MTDVEVRPRCVHRGCTTSSYAGFIMCLDHIKEAKRIQIEANAEKTTKDGAVLQSPT
jgi:hypothetical protein